MKKSRLVEEYHAVLGSKEKNYGDYYKICLLKIGEAYLNDLVSIDIADELTRDLDAARTEKGGIERFLFRIDNILSFYGEE